MFNDPVSDDLISYLCKVDISNDNYEITIYGFENRLIFKGGLDEFSDKYDEII
jgi:hypothetical protein